MTLPTPSDPQTLSAALAALAHRPAVLVALDFDGCLAPLVQDPMQARPLPESVAALRILAASDTVQVALVSGRPADNLLSLADPPPGTWVIGSHGAEVAEVTRTGELRQSPVDLTAEQADLLARLTAALEEIAAQHPGSRVEHKPAAVALHTRGMPPEAAERALEAALEGPGAYDGAHPIRGNNVTELAVVAATKGEALTALRDRLARERPTPGPHGIAVLYAGDDITDETALATLGPGDVGVKVGTAPSVAPYRVGDERDVAAMLTALAGLTGPAEE